jgi:anti-anti-sigma factor
MGRIPLRSIADFRITIEPLEDACVMRVTGELDSGTADRLRGTLGAARRDGLTTVLDMAGVAFIDAAGLRVLLEAARATDRHDWAWFIVRPSPVVLRLIELSGFTRRLPIVEPQSVSPAAAARARPGRGRAALPG